MTDSLQDALQDIARSFGAGSVVRLGDVPAEPVEAISTGSAALDEALGIGGLPKGRVVELFGEIGVGKTTICLSTIAEAQKQGLTCVFIDTEHAMDPIYAAAIGVDLDSLFFVQPSSAEEALEIAAKLIASGEIGMLVLDSVAALVTQAELAGEMGDLGVGQKARLVGQAMRKLVPAASKTNTLLLLVNQNRTAIGVMFGSPIIQPGGKAIKYAASQRVEVKRGQSAKRTGADPHKVECKAKVVKNRLAAPFREAEFWIVFGRGIVDKKG